MKTKTTMAGGTVWRGLGILAAFGAGAAAVAYFLRRRAALHGYDKQFTGAFPRGTGAVSAVTGGSPEDMNGMPASPEAEGPTYDGSQLTH